MIHHPFWLIIPSHWCPLCPNRSKNTSGLQEDPQTLTKTRVMEERQARKNATRPGCVVHSCVPGPHWWVTWDGWHRCLEDHDAIFHHWADAFERSIQRSRPWESSYWVLKSKGPRRWVWRTDGCLSSTFFNRCHPFLDCSSLSQGNANHCEPLLATINHYPNQKIITTNHRKPFSNHHSHKISHQRSLQTTTIINQHI